MSDFWVVSVTVSDIYLWCDCSQGRAFEERALNLLSAQKRPRRLWPRALFIGACVGSAFLLLLVVFSIVLSPAGSHAHPPPADGTARAPAGPLAGSSRPPTASGTGVHWEDTGVGVSATDAPASVRQRQQTSRWQWFAPKMRSRSGEIHKRDHELATNVYWDSECVLVCEQWTAAFCLHGAPKWIVLSGLLVNKTG